MSFATANDLIVVSAEIDVPLRGPWTGVFRLDTQATLTGAVVLRLGDLELRGTIRRGGDALGASDYKIVAGNAAWHTVLPAKGYRATSVRLSAVLNDAARETGETISVAADTSIGEAYVREAGPASRVLEQLCRDGWHVGYDGVTRNGPRFTEPVDVEHDVINFEPQTRVVQVASEAPQGFVPGRTLEVEGQTLTISSVRFALDSGALRVELNCEEPGTEKPIIAALRRAVREQDPGQTYKGCYEYRVASQSGNLLDLQATKRDIGLPDLAKVRIRPGVPGVRADVALGSHVIVTFINGDPSRPWVQAFEEPDGQGWAPPSVAIVADEVNLGSLSPAQFVALADYVEQRFVDLFTAFQGASITPTDGGAAFKASLLVYLGLQGWSLTGITPGVGATKTRAE